MTAEQTFISNDYPGYPLSIGSEGAYVTKMQSYLNIIREKLYPELVLLKVDGIFGSKTQSTVIQYQSLVGLEADGIIGKLTWYSIVLNVESLSPLPHDEYPGYPLSTGSSGESVAKMQSYLNKIKETKYPTLVSLKVDGAFGSKTRTTVKQYQTLAALEVDGIIGNISWDSIVYDYYNP